MHSIQHLWGASSYKLWQFISKEVLQRGCAPLGLCGGFAEDTVKNSVSGLRQGCTHSFFREGGGQTPQAGFQPLHISMPLFFSSLTLLVKIISRHGKCYRSRVISSIHLFISLFIYPPLFTYFYLSCLTYISSIYHVFHKCSHQIGLCFKT